jgi:thymidylate synthase (FAD)
MVTIIKQSFELITPPEWLEHANKLIEKSARNCYKSEDKITSDGKSAQRINKMLLEKQHGAMIEFGGMITVRLITDRNTSHQIVRHRLCSFAQESTRWIDYKKKYDGITVILPEKFVPYIYLKDGFHFFIDNVPKSIKELFYIWLESMANAEKSYIRLKNIGIVNDISKLVLPQSLKTEIDVGTNLREWRHIFRERCSPNAHLHNRTLMRRVLMYFKSKIPIIFDDFPDYDIKK